jgi:hypothetical protein
VKKSREFPYLEQMPVINLACPQSLNSWLQMRLAVLEFGKKYTIRVQLYMSVFFVIYALITFGICFTFFKNQVAVFTPMTIVILYDIVVIMAMVITTFQVGSRVNMQYNKDISQLSNIRHTLSFITINFNSLILNNQSSDSMLGGEILNIFKTILN